MLTARHSAGNVVLGVCSSFRFGAGVAFLAIVAAETRALQWGFLSAGSAKEATPKRTTRTAGLCRNDAFGRQGNRQDVVGRGEEKRKRERAGAEKGKVA